MNNNNNNNNNLSNSQLFMVKKIMNLSNSHNKDFLDLMNPTPTPPPPQQHEDNHNHNNNTIKEGVVVVEEEEEIIMPNYDFQPINRWKTSSSSDSKINNNSDVQFKIEPIKAGNEPSLMIMMSEIDHIMKKHVDNLMHAMEGVSARLTQMETRTRGLENVLDDMKVSVGNYYGTTDGKMRQLEIIMREVKTGVEVVKDKQEILEAQIQLAKLQISKPDKQQSETPSSGKINSVPHQPASTLQSYQQPPPPTTYQQQPVINPPQPSLPDVPPHQPPPQTNPQLPNPNQYPQPPQREPYFPPPGQSQTLEATYSHYPAGPVTPPNLQSQPPTVAPPQQPYPPAPQQHYPPPAQPPQPQHHPSQPPVNSAPPQPHHHEEPPYNIPAQNYPPNLRQPPGGPPPTQQFYGTPPSPSMYEAPPSGRSSAGFPTGYGSQQSGPIEPYGYGGPPSQYGPSSAIKPQQQFPSISQSGPSGYPQLPTARVLPQALPTASSVSGGGGGSSSPGPGNKVPLDDVVDKVTNMGFPKDHVRATVRKLIENGQSVDLNVVLDKLMNDGDVPPPRGGWFSR
ncbi:hypothetical protein ACFE04_009904 [Oxalis oulophora]